MKYFQSILLFFIVISTTAQQPTDNSVVQALQFGEHLVLTNQGEEASFFLEKLKYQQLDRAQNDQLFYLLGWNYYKQKQLQKSTQHLIKVSLHSSYYHKSQFFASYNQIYLNQLDKAKMSLQTIQLENKNLFELQQFELAGIALLERDYASFDSLKKHFSMQYFPIVREEKKLVHYYEQLKNFKYKKKGLAALYSALIPGSGKVYAGRLGDGISSFLIVSSLGLITAENVRKAGFENVKTIFFGSMFTVFYIGNIWGSYFSVQMQNDEFNHEMDHKILFDLHIPLRTIFN